MITERDIDFHTPSNPPYDWAETSYFYCYNVEANILAWIYLVCRPGIGAAAVDVSAIDMIGTKTVDALYVDFQQHLPLPKSLSDLSLPNGLTVKVGGPREYRLDYATDEAQLALDVNGVMEPYDIHDPSMDPMAESDPRAAIEHSGFGAAYASHFDMTAHVSGTLQIRGRAIDIDCTATMDHSWGQRTERGQRPMVWANANFDDRHAVQTIWSLDPTAGPADQYTFRHGYVLVDGMVKGLVGGRLRSRRLDQFAMTYEMVLTDLEGIEHVLYGGVQAMIPWAAYSCTFVPTGMFRWHWESRVGYGVVQENFPLDSHAGKRLHIGRND